MLFLHFFVSTLTCDHMRFDSGISLYTFVICCDLKRKFLDMQMTFCMLKDTIKTYIERPKNFFFTDKTMV